METTRVIKVKQSVLANNDLRADAVRQKLKKKGIYLVNVMSSPGSGKTTLLLSLIEKLKKDLRIGVIEADMDALVDAKTIEEKTGVRTIQLHTSGECHLDAKMVDEALDFLGEDDFDLVFLENIGNLVCPAEFETGANLRLVLLSVPEGDDKPLKYPLMFRKGGCFVFTKMDALLLFDFDLQKVEKEILDLNDKAVFFPVSAKKDECVSALSEYLLAEVKKNKEA